MSAAYHDSHRHRSANHMSSSPASSSPTDRTFDHDYHDAASVSDPVASYTLFMREYTRRQMDSALRSSPGVPSLKSETSQCSNASV